MYICVDFDGTIVDHRYPEIGPEAPGAIFWMNEWHTWGAKLILYTMRSDDNLLDAVDYLVKKGMSLYGTNDNPGQYEWTSSRKIYANLYVDDAAFGVPLIQPEGFARPCVDWSVVGPEVLKKLKGE